MNNLFHHYRDFNTSLSKERRLVFEKGVETSGETTGDNEVRGRLDALSGSLDGVLLARNERGRRRSPYPTPDLRHPLAEPEPPRRLEEEKIPGERGEAKKREERKEATEELMEDAEIQLMEQNVVSLLQHFNNPSFRLYLRAKLRSDEEKMVGALRIAIKYSDELKYTAEGAKITITKRLGSVKTEIPDDFHIVLENGRLTEIGALKLDTAQYKTWEEAARYAEECRAKQEEYEAKRGNKPTEEEGAYDDFILSELPSVVLESIRLRGELPGEKTLLESPAFKAFQKDAKDDSLIVITIGKNEKNPKDIQIFTWRPDNAEVAVIIFDPAGFIIIEQTDGNYQRLPLYEHGFGNRYKIKKDRGSIPHPVPPPRLPDPPEPIKEPPVAPPPAPPDRGRSGPKTPRETGPTLAVKIDQLYADPMAAMDLFYKEEPKKKQDRIRPLLEEIKKGIATLKEKPWFNNALSQIKADLAGGRIRPDELIPTDSDSVRSLATKYKIDLLDLAGSAKTILSIAIKVQAIRDIVEE